MQEKNLRHNRRNQSLAAGFGVWAPRLLSCGIAEVSEGGAPLIPLTFSIASGDNSTAFCERNLVLWIEEVRGILAWGGVDKGGGELLQRNCEKPTSKERWIIDDKPTSSNQLR
jgi:hypothetical protein